jgi:hypothetical protein
MTDLDGNAAAGELNRIFAREVIGPSSRDAYNRPTDVDERIRGSANPFRAAGHNNELGHSRLPIN